MNDSGREGMEMSSGAMGIVFFSPGELGRRSMDVCVFGSEEERLDTDVKYSSMTDFIWKK